MLASYLRIQIDHVYTSNYHTTIACLQLKNGKAVDDGAVGIDVTEPCEKDK